jgi:hypothetical protein
MPRPRLADLDPHLAPPAAQPVRQKRRRSPAQAAASRANGARSHGPVSAAGRRISAMNAFAHGLCSTTLGKLEGEDAAEYATFLDNYRAELEPYGWDGIDAADRMARSAWQVRRADALMARALDEVMTAAGRRGAGGLLGALERHRAALSLLQRYRQAAARDIARCAWLIEEAKRRRDRQERDDAAQERRLRALAEDAARRRHEALWGLKPSDHGAPDPRGPLSPHVYALEEAPPAAWRNEPGTAPEPARAAEEQTAAGRAAAAAAGAAATPATPTPATAQTAVAGLASAPLALTPGTAAAADDPPAASPADPAPPRTRAEARERLILALVRGTLKNARKARAAAAAEAAEMDPVRRRDRRRSARSPG